MAASYFLLLAQKKVTKEKGTLGAAALEGTRRAKALGPRFRGDDETWIASSLLLRFGDRDCRALLFPGPSRPRRAGGGNCRVHRTRSRAGCARVRCQYRDVLSADPVACSRSRRGMDAPATAAARVSFSLVTFFWTSKRKSPADRDVRRTTHGREPVLEATLNPKRRTNTIPTQPSP